MAYTYSWHWDWVSPKGCRYLQSSSIKTRSKDAIVITFPDADSLMRVLEPGDRPPAFWTKRAPGWDSDIILLRLASLAYGKHGLLPGYVVAMASRVGFHEPRDCYICFKRDEQPAWYNINDCRGYHIVFNQVTGIDPSLVNTKGDIAYIPIEHLKRLGIHIGKNKTTAAWRGQVV